MTKHTPGPWTVDAIETTLVRAPDRYPIADLESHFREITECEANARLIADAPETAAERERLKESNACLLAALKKVREIIIVGAAPTPFQYADLVQAIEDAEGK